MARSPSSVNLFPNGWNWDEVRVLKFIPGTHTKGLTLLQSDHFRICCSRRPYSANNGQKHQAIQVRITNHKQPACIEGGGTPNVPSLLGTSSQFHPFGKRFTELGERVIFVSLPQTAKISWEKFRGSFTKYPLTVFTLISLVLMLQGWPGKCCDWCIPKDHIILYGILICLEWSIGQSSCNNVLFVFGMGSIIVHLLSCCYSILHSFQREQGRHRSVALRPNLTNRRRNQRRLCRENKLSTTNLSEKTQKTVLGEPGWPPRPSKSPWTSSPTQI